MEGVSNRKCVLLNGLYTNFSIGKLYSIVAEDSTGFSILNDKEEPEFVSTEGFCMFFKEFTGRIGSIPISTSPEGVDLLTDDKHKGLRFNNGKIRYDLLHPIATEGVARVMTKGSLKYSERNWERGMKWSNVLASMKRHTAAFEKGIDYDIDPKCPDCQRSTPDNWVCKNHTGELHVDLIQTNAHFLSAYYKIYPQGDDRPHKYLNTPKIGLDIDEVLCDWVGDWTKKYEMNMPSTWWFDSELLAKFGDMRVKGELDDFYLALKPLIKPEDIPFEPHCYITSRPVSSEITERWLSLWGFPARPVFTTSDKVGVAKEQGIDIFVDDNFTNFTNLNNAGICCFLMDARHNQRYDVGYKRIKSLGDLTY